MSKHSSLIWIFRSSAQLGVCAIEDPLRPEVPGAIAAAARAGISVKMLTGEEGKRERVVGRWALPGACRAQEGGEMLPSIGMDWRSGAQRGARRGTRTI